jgi:hypothetical protein
MTRGGGFRMTRDSLTPALSRGERGRRREAGGRKALPYISRITREKGREAVQIQVGDSFGGVFDSRRESFGDFEEGFLGGALALEVAGSGEESRVDRAGLGKCHAGLDSGLSRLACRGDDPRGVAVAFEDGGRLAAQVRLAAKARGEREERDEEAGEH